LPVFEIDRHTRPAAGWYRPEGRKKIDVRKLAGYVEREKHCVYLSYSYSALPLQPKCAPVRISQSRGAATAAAPALERPSATPQYVQTVQTLIELLELPGGWNSYDASPIRKENVNFSVDLLSRLMRADTPAPQVVPKVRGGVQLEWHTRGVNIEIDIESPGSVTFFAENIGNGQECVEQEFDENAVEQWIQRLSV
jgi:hypothetical protein